ncbi:ATP-binding protein [Streptomyces sp. TRM64462]|uniref:ATP-binding protein n=1 Tax=Streptomyces sp. TRM64462 TaxID=2741726 RepID=UPI001586DC52|nr:ATP-binding protein [Streptomyces sp. TRM64462]
MSLTRRTTAAVPEPEDGARYTDHAVWHLPTRTDAAALARRAVRSHLRRWQVGEPTADVAELLVSELVANAVQHGAPPIVLRLDHGHGTLSITVHDGGKPATAPRPASASRTAERGRGLHLISALADAFAVTCDRRGTSAQACLGTAYGASDGRAAA